MAWRSASCVSDVALRFIADDAPLIMASDAGEFSAGAVVTPFRGDSRSSMMLDTGPKSTSEELCAAGKKYDKN